MKFNERLQRDIARFREYVILVEGKNDVEALKAFGFEKVYALHKTGITIRERIEQLAPLIDKKQKICILTDLDRQGKKLYEVIKPIIQELGFQTDSTFRGILIKAKVPNVEGISNFLDKVERMEQEHHEFHLRGRGRPHRWGGKRF